MYSNPAALRRREFAEGCWYDRAVQPSDADELRELVRGLRRQISLLGDAGFVAIGRDLADAAGSEVADKAAGPHRALETALAPATTPEVSVHRAVDVAQPSNTPVSDTPDSQSQDTVPKKARLDADDTTRRSLYSAKGEVKRTKKEKIEALVAVADRVASCKLCGLCKDRIQAVPGEGSPTARILFVGEGPGAQEDAEGRPFVGRSGQLLTKIIESGMGLPRSEVFIANIVKCRPPENRDPAPDEVAACIPFLHKQIEIIDPEVIIPLGRYSMRELAGVGEKDTIGRVRGQVYRVQGRAVIPTYHPAYLLRNPPEKVKVWNDIQLAMKELGLPIPKNP